MTSTKLIARTTFAPRTTRPDELAARRSLRQQIARLEEELAGLFTSGWPGAGFDWALGAGAGAARILGIGELEELRDTLCERVREAKEELARRARAEDEHRRLVEEMLLDPEGHRWVRVTNEDLGEPGCKSWHVRPRFGLLGILMRWWRVVVSSGCP